MNFDVTKLILNELIDDDSSEESSDSEGCSDEETLLVSLWSQAKRKRNTIVNNCSNFVTRYGNDEFIRRFRLSKGTFDRLVALYEGNNICKTLTPDKRMLMFLWFAGQEACSYREMGKMFDVCLSSVHEVIFQVSSFLSGLAASYIVWPDNERKKKCEEYFLHHKGFPGVIGCIGRTHVLIDPPKNNKEDFVDRKGNFSISLQLVCNHEKIFTDVFIGQTGPTDEASIYLASPLCADLHQRVGQGQYLVGDYVYPCETCLLTPYENTGQLTDEQQNFNWKLNSCRIFIEEAKADLKRRFRQLYYCKLKGLPNLCHFVRACVVLHNMSEPDDLKYLEPAHAEEDLTDSTVCEALTERRGNNLRDEVCHLLCKQ